MVAHSILHHIENLEHAFDEIEKAMKPDATLIGNEYVGPNRFHFSDRALSIMNELLSCLPPRSGSYERKERPRPEFMIKNDPTEAVRSEDLVPMIEQRFDVLDRKELGGTISCISCTTSCRLPVGGSARARDHRDALRLRRGAG